MSNTEKQKIIQVLLWTFIFGGFLSLLIYGASAFTQKPTVETITTHAPESGRDSKSMQEIKYQKRRK